MPIDMIDAAKSAREAGDDVVDCAQRHSSRVLDDAKPPTWSGTVSEQVGPNVARFAWLERRLEAPGISDSLAAKLWHPNRPAPNENSKPYSTTCHRERLCSIDAALATWIKIRGWGRLRHSKVNYPADHFHHSGPFGLTLRSPLVSSRLELCCLRRLRIRDSLFTLCGESIGQRE